MKRSASLLFFFFLSLYQNVLFAQEQTRFKNGVDQIGLFGFQFGPTLRRDKIGSFMPSNGDGDLLLCP